MGQGVRDRTRGGRVPCSGGNGAASEMRSQPGLRGEGSGVPRPARSKHGHVGMVREAAAGPEDSRSARGAGRPARWTVLGQGRAARQAGPRE